DADDRPSQYSKRRKAGISRGTSVKRALYSARSAGSSSARCRAPASMCTVPPSTGRASAPASISLTSTRLGAPAWRITRTVTRGPRPINPQLSAPPEEEPAPRVSNRGDQRGGRYPPLPCLGRVIEMAKQRKATAEMAGVDTSTNETTDNGAPTAGAPNPTG